MAHRYFNTEITQALDEALKKDSRVILLGEDIQDPFGGCFRITKGLSTKYPDRVINTPISEAAIMGIAIGLAMQGFKPVIEIMFYDFMTLCFDQVFNHALKFHQYIQPINITIRTVIGKEDYGWQHSQNLDWLFSKFMYVAHPTPYNLTKEYLKVLINEPYPVLWVEESKYYKERIK